MVKSKPTTSYRLIVNKVKFLELLDPTTSLYTFSIKEHNKYIFHKCKKYTTVKNITSFPVPLILAGNLMV